MTTDHTRRRIWIPWFVLAAALAATLLSTAYTVVTTRAKDRSRFQNAVESTQNAVHERIDTYVDILRSASGFAAAHELTATEFRIWVEHLNLQRQLPGIQGVGFSVRLPREAEPALVEKMRGEGFLSFHVWPPPSRPYFHSIIYLEPLDRRNLAAIGYDMFTEPTRRRAMEVARDTGLPAASGRVTLVQEIDRRKQPGFLIYVPVYGGERLPATLAERRDRLTGFIYAPFRAEDLLSGILSSVREPRVDFAMYDGRDLRPEGLLYESAKDVAGAHARFMKETHLDTAEHRWTLIFATRPEFEAASTLGYAWFLFLGGTAFSFVLFGVTLAQGRARQDAESALRDLRDRERELRAETERLAEMNRIGRILSAELDPERVVQAVIDAGKRVTGAAFAAFFYAQDSGPGDGQRYALAGIPPSSFEGMELPRSTALFGPTYRGEAIIRLADVTEDPRFGQSPPYYGLPPGHPRVRSYLAIPVISRSGDVLGGLFFGHPARGVFGKREEEIGATLSAQAAIALDNAMLFKAAQHDRMEAEIANRTKDDFLANVSHELRTPMTAILGWSALIEHAEHDPELFRSAIEAIRRSSKAQAQLIDDLLDVSRISVGKMEIEREPVELRTLVSSAVRSIRPAAEEREIRIELRTPVEELVVSGDARRLQQVVWNLLSNAVKFTPASGLISVSLARSDGQAELVVEDNGQGIDQELLPQIFDRFRQGDTTLTRSHGGLGIGLSIVKHIVEMHGGTVTAESEGRSRGARFTTCLPLIRPSVSKGERTESGSRDGGVDLSRATLLVVEDQAEVRAYIAATLEQAGARVVECGSGGEAFSALLELQFDAVVSDLAMPGQDGYELIARIRSSPVDSLREIPALALTALTRAQDREKATTSGFDAYLQKPVDPLQLKRAVRDLLSARAG